MLSYQQTIKSIYTSYVHKGGETQQSSIKLVKISGESFCSSVGVKEDFGRSEIHQSVHG